MIKLDAKIETLVDYINAHGETKRRLKDLLEDYYEAKDEEEDVECWEPEEVEEEYLDNIGECLAELE